MVDQDEKQRVFQASLEYWKATYEYFKTFATICLASIAAFSALLAGVFAEPPKNVANSMFSLIRCLVPKILSWSQTIAGYLWRYSLLHSPWWCSTGSTGCSKNIPGHYPFRYYSLLHSPWRGSTGWLVRISPA